MFTYFWFVCGAVASLNVLIWHGRLKRLVDAGRITAEEARRFTRGALIAFLVPTFLLGIASWWLGYESPSCFEPFRFGDIGNALLNLITLSCWALLLGWLWLGSGADLLSRIGPVLINVPNYERTYSPTTVRLVVTAMLLLAGAGAFWSSPDRRPHFVSCGNRSLR